MPPQTHQTTTTTIYFYYKEQSTIYKEDELREEIGSESEKR